MSARERFEAPPPTLYVCQIGTDPPFIATAAWGARILAACTSEDAAWAALSLLMTPTHVYRFGRWIRVADARGAQA